jgi:GNAT superfamily N-acetyltransferase
MPAADDPRFRPDDLRFRAERFRTDDPRLGAERFRAAGPRFGAERFRAAGPGDAPAVAGLHADSWRQHYRGALSDAFLDHDVAGYLLPLWTERLATPDPRARTILAEYHGELVGLAHTILDEDATWGAFLDNLHVRATLKRQGIGSRLLALTGQAVLDANPSSGLWLWVLEQNSAARAFYAARGAICVERDHVSPPGDDPANLNGNPVALKYAWRDPSILLPAAERSTP